MRSFVQHVEAVCERPGMFVAGGSYREVEALLVGYNLATCDGGLVGFREWLVVRLDGGNNLSWSPLVLQAAFPETLAVDPDSFSAEQTRTALTTLRDLVADFVATRERVGLPAILLSHHKWLSRQEWRRPESAD